MEPLSDPWKMQYRCITCRFKAGKLLTNGNEEWYWRPVSTGFAGPFCSEDCSSVWAAWPRDRQIAAILGGYLLGLKLLHRRPQLPDGIAYIARYTEGGEAPKHAINTNEESLHWRDLAWSRS